MEIIVGFIVLLSDQLVKKYYLSNQNLFLVENHGLLFGWNFGWVWWVWIAIFIGLILSIFLLKNKKHFFGEILIISGVLSNLIDRFVHKAILDYLSIKSLYFNIADIAILLGLVVYIYQIFIYEKRSKN